MAKGDKKKVDTAITNQRSMQVPWQQGMNTQIQTRYNEAATRDRELRDQLTKNYMAFKPTDMQSILGKYGGLGQASGGIDVGRINTAGAKPYAGFEEFSKTGGFSEGDLQNIRERAIAPSRAIYANAQNEIARRNAVSGGNIANIGALTRAMNRDANQQISDTNVNANAAIAEMVQRGKGFGLSGMSDLDKIRLQGELQNAGLNQNASIANMQQGLNIGRLVQGEDELSLAGLGGLRALYGTSPAASDAAMNDLLNEQQLMQGGNLGLINSQIQASTIPSDFDVAMGRVGRGLQIGGSIAGGLSGLGLFGGAGGGMSNMPSYMPSGNINNPYSVRGNGMRF